MDILTPTTNANIDLLPEGQWCQSHTIGAILPQSNGLTLVKQFLQKPGSSKDMIKTISVCMFNKSGTTPLRINIETRFNAESYNHGSFIIREYENICIQREAHEEARCLVLDSTDVCIDDGNIDSSDIHRFVVTIVEMVDTNKIHNYRPSDRWDAIDMTENVKSKIAKVILGGKSDQTFEYVNNYIPKVGGHTDCITIIPVIYEDRVNYRLKEIISLLDNKPQTVKYTDYPSWGECYPGIFIGDQFVTNENAEMTNMITKIINVAYPEIQVHPSYVKKGLNVKNYTILDTGDYCIIDHFPNIFNEIDKELDKNGKVFVSCFAGYSRSTSIVLAYMIKKKKISLRDAIVHLQTLKLIIRPTECFLRQLVIYEDDIMSNRNYNVHDSIFCNVQSK